MRSSPPNFRARTHTAWGRLCIPLFLVFHAGLTSLGHADTIYLKDGRTVVGIVDQSLSDDRRVVISTPNGPLHIPKNKIERVDIRQDVSKDEVRGDLSANEQDFDKAMEFYLKAYAAQSDNKELEKKIAAVKEKIKERDAKRFGQEFEKIDKVIATRDFEGAVAMAKALADKTEQGSAKQSCMAKLAQAYIEQARDFRNTVNYPQAEKSYRQAMDAYPGGAVAQLELADLVRRTPTRQQEATDLYGQGIELAIKDPTLLDKKDLLRYRNEYAEIHLSSQKYRESAKLFWTVIENDPAGLYYKAPDSIIRAYLSIGPDLVPDTPENKEAISILVKIIEKRPTEDKAHYMLGKIYFDRNDYPKAIGYLDQALKNMGGGFGAPNFADCHYYLALAYRRTDKLEDAIKLLRALLEIQPARYEAICELAEIYFDLSDYNNAIGQFRRGVNVEPSNYRAYIGAGRTLRRIEKYNEAIVMYEQLIKLKDDNYHYFFEMGLTYTALNRHERARDTYLKVIEMVGKSTDPNAAETRSMLGDVYTYLAIANLALKKYNESLEQLDKALTYHDNYGKALEAKGLAYRELGQLAQAEDFFNKALTTDPKRPEFYLNLGVLNHKFKKDTQTALTFYQKYYENGGADPQVAEWIRECGGTPPK